MFLVLLSQSYKGFASDNAPSRKRARDPRSTIRSDTNRFTQKDLVDLRGPPHPPAEFLEIVLAFQQQATSAIVQNSTLWL